MADPIRPAQTYRPDGDPDDAPARDPHGPLRLVGYDPESIVHHPGGPNSVIVDMYLSRPLTFDEQWHHERFVEMNAGSVRILPGERMVPVTAKPTALPTLLAAFGRHLTNVEAAGKDTEQRRLDLTDEAARVLHGMSFD